MPDAKRARQIVRRLEKMYPDAHCELKHKNPLQLLIATILSAQCTDVRVNQVTPALFARYPTAQDFAQASLPELESMIRSTGFFHNKAVNIRACCQGIVEKHDGRVPNTMAALVALKGVGRKTANVVLGNAFGIPGLVVDTHVSRIANLLRLTKNKDPKKIETDLMAVIPKKDWTQFSHLLIFHGRRICKARKPMCQDCGISDLCPSRLIVGCDIDACL